MATVAVLGMRVDAVGHARGFIGDTAGGVRDGVSEMASELTGAPDNDSGETAAAVDDAAAVEVSAYPDPIVMRNMPAVTAPSTSLPAAMAQPAQAETTTTAPSPLPGNLDVGKPITKPSCDGGFITVLSSITDIENAEVSVKMLLARYGDLANYLRTDLTCASLNPEPVYVVYYGPFPTKQLACDARPADSSAYVRVLAPANDTTGGC